jgi:hemerythrin-like metal-binding protein
MPTVTWSESFNTGSQSIDRQHRELFDGIDALEKYFAAESFGASNARCRALREQLWTHFAHEEALLRETDFQRLEAHAATHALARRKIEGILSQCHENCRNGTRIGCVAHWLVTLLDDVLLPDLDFKSHLEAENVRR